MLIVSGALGMVLKGLVRGLEMSEIGGGFGIIQTTALLTSARILRRVLETWEDFCHSDSSERSSAHCGVKNLQEVEMEKRDKYLDLAKELKKNYGTWK